MLEAVQAVDPDTQLNLALVAGYWSTDMFLKALEETGQDLTVESFLETLNGDFTYSIEGAVGESKWPATTSSRCPCAALHRGGGRGVRARRSRSRAARTSPSSEP